MNRSDTRQLFYLPECSVINLFFNSYLNQNEGGLLMESVLLISTNASPHCSISKDRSLRVCVALASIFTASLPTPLAACFLPFIKLSVC